MHPRARALTVPHLAVVGGGWAGLTAAVRARQAGWQVTVFEMAPQFGGRARSGTGEGPLLDNGQHILIGAYRRCLALMSELGVPLDEALLRLPLTLEDVHGRGLALRPARTRGGAIAALLAAIVRARGWTAADRASLVGHAMRWAAAGFRCDPAWSVDRLCRAMPAGLRAQLIDPLCVAAMNTPSRDASAQVFLRVLRDALLGGPGSADLLLPRWPLGQLLPEPAERWLRDHGARLCTATRVQALTPCDAGWDVDGQRFEAVVLACSAHEAARLGSPHAPDWAQRVSGLRFEPIVTVQVHCPGVRLPQPMIALAEGPEAPAQFLFDHGAIGGHGGWMSAVISGAAAWVDVGRDATSQAVVAQLLRQLPPHVRPGALRVAAVVAEKRATFRCVPGLERPARRIARRLVAASDFVEGPYPATLEGAVMAGEAAVQDLMTEMGLTDRAMPHSS